MDTSVDVKLLLVDDTPANLLVLEAVLDPLNYKIVKAHSGFEAIEILKTTDISLVILDVQMPNLDGFETAKLIKEKLPEKNVPIIFMTAIYKEDPFIHKGYEVGGVDYFGKPFDPAVLKAKVRIHAEMYRQTKLLQQMEVRMKEMERKLAANGIKH
jgi:two-component system, sensor histidine kinase